MRQRILMCVLLLVAAGGGSTSHAGEVTLHADEPVRSIAFGSCARESRPQPLWDAINAKSPQVWVWLGDNIYGDTQDMAVMRAKYDRLAAIPGYARLARSATILATWDDHDYGENDAGEEFPAKRESKAEFLRFFDDPPDSPRRSRDGIYISYLLGPPGQQVQLILLDTRWFRSPLLRGRVGQDGPRGYVPDPDPSKTILGPEQWTWLEAQLKIPAEVRIIASSIQLIPAEHRFEKWENFPHERTRMLDLLKALEQPVYVISGDRHHGEVSRLGNLTEITASAINQARPPQIADEPNRHRIGQIVYEPNFGLIEIDWSGDVPQVRWGLFGQAGTRLQPPQ